MPSHPSLHLCFPASTPEVGLEVRLFLAPHLLRPRAGTPTNEHALVLHAMASEMLARGEPTELQELKDEQKEALKALRVDKVVTASHPWGRLGGNMSFPVISQFLPTAIFGPAAAPPKAADAPNIAIATYNQRGIGKSGGSMPIPSFGLGNDPADFGTIEATILDLVGTDATQVYRLGYSYGTLLALNAAPPARGVASTMLVSPAPTLFKGLTLFGGPTFEQGLSGVVERAAGAVEPPVAGAADGATETVPAAASTDAATAALPPTAKKALWIVYGSKDDFTGVATLRALAADTATHVEIEGCGHFYARQEDGVHLAKAIADWMA